MKAFISYLQFGIGHHQTITQPGEKSKNTESKETTSILGLQKHDQLLNPNLFKPSSGDEANNIIIPKPRKPDTTWSYLGNYMKMQTTIMSGGSGNNGSSESNDSGVKSEGDKKSYPEITKEERALKVKKYLKKRRRKNGTRKIRYQYRQELADKRIRFQGRFIKPTEAKNLIMQGVPVTIKDKSELNKLFDEDKDQEVLKKYNENLQKKNLKRVFKTVYDTSIVDRLSGGEKSSCSSNSSISSSRSAMSPLIENMDGMNLNSNTEGKFPNTFIQPPPILKL